MDNIILIQNGILMRIETRLYRHISYTVCCSLVAQSEPAFDELMINACAMQNCRKLTAIPNEMPHAHFNNNFGPQIAMIDRW